MWSHIPPFMGHMNVKGPNFMSYANGSPTEKTKMDKAKREEEKVRTQEKKGEDQKEKTCAVYYLISLNKLSTESRSNCTKIAVSGSVYLCMISSAIFGKDSEPLTNIRSRRSFV